MLLPKLEDVHDTNNDNVDAETNWLTDHNYYSPLIWFTVVLKSIQTQ